MIDRPLGSELSAVYPWATGLALDVRIARSQQVSVSVQAAPLVAWGTPATGSLASAAEANLLQLPGYLIVEYSHPWGALRPYLGAGAGVVYVQESLVFQGPLGERNPSRSTTRFSWTVMAGLEPSKQTRPFAEIHYQHAGTAGVEGQSGSGVSLAHLQLRIGVRTRLK